MRAGISLTSGTITYREQFSRCGKAECRRCAPGNRGHGPYWYAYWREGGRLRSRYLGKRSPPELLSPDSASDPPSRPDHGPRQTMTNLRALLHTLGKILDPSGEVDGYVRGAQESLEAMGAALESARAGVVLAGALPDPGARDTPTTADREEAHRLRDRARKTFAANGARLDLLEAAGQ
jgi:hypothetical protein